MPNKKNAEKALRQSQKRQKRNDDIRHSMYDIKRRIKKAADENTTDDLDALIKESQKILDKAAKRHVIRKNSASRKKSSLAKMTNSLNKKEDKTTIKKAKKKTVKKATKKVANKKK